MSKAHPPTCMDEFDPNNLPVEEARRRINDRLRPVEGFERLAIRAALGRVLAEDVYSTFNVPPYANSAMDGYAVASDDLPAGGAAELLVIGTAFAGTPFEGAVQRGESVRIMTGAVLPDGADTVIMQEHVEREGDLVRIQPGYQLGQNVRHPGEDIKAGDVVLSKGTTLTPADLGLAASLGIAELKICRRPCVAFFSTGDELRSIGEPLEEGQIYDSNRYTLYGMLHRVGMDVIDMGVVPDDRQAVRDAFSQAVAVADVIVTSGGVSVGEADYVKEILDELGQVDFWKIAMKPGKPLAFGRVGGAFFFGLPGNPVSVMATFYQFVQPALLRLMGARATESLILRVPCTSDLKKRPGRVDFQRGVLRRNGQGDLVVETTGLQGSHVLSSMTRADCFVILPLESGDVKAGTLVDVQPFAGLI